MQQVDRALLLASLMVAGSQLAACQPQSSDYSKVEPAHVEQVDGSELKHVVLTEKAIERIDLKTAIVREIQVSDGSGQVTRKVIPYSALIYDPKGETWVYISPEPRRFVRHAVKVERIEGDNALLLSGPEKDSEIAAIGAAELYGVESGVGH